MLLPNLSPVRALCHLSHFNIDSVSTFAGSAIIFLFHVLCAELQCFAGSQTESTEEAQPGGIRDVLTKDAPL